MFWPPALCLEALSHTQMVVHIQAAMPGTHSGDHAWYTYRRLCLVHISTVNDTERIKDGEQRTVAGESHVKDWGDGKAEEIWHGRVDILGMAGKTRKTTLLILEQIF
jgi:hypothetical protein